MTATMKTARRKPTPLPKSEHFPGEFILAKRLMISVRRLRQLMKHGGGNHWLCVRYVALTGRSYDDLLYGKGR